ncbi:MAG: hypothetical protein ACYCZX_13520 [Rhodospirillaceae bacterium]
MVSFTDRLKGLFGGKKKRAPVKPAKSAKTYVTSKTNRAEVMAEAMAVYRRERGQMQAGLDKQLTQMREDAPKLLHDPEALARLLTLHRAHMDMRKLMASDNKRFLVLSGMRELLGDPPVPQKTKKPPAKR